MSEIERRIRNGKVRWVARWNDGRRRAKVFDRKIDAHQFLAQTKVSLVTGNYVDPARGKISLSAMADKWLKTQNHLKPSTLARYRGIVEKHIRPRWGATMLVKITHADVAEWISSIRLSARECALRPQGAVVDLGACRTRWPDLAESCARCTPS
jgi:hypothetical protein